MKLDQILAELEAHHHGEFEFEDVPSKCIRTIKEYPTEMYVIKEDGTPEISDRQLCPAELIWLDHSDGRTVSAEIDDTMLELGGIEDPYFGDEEFITAADHNKFEPDDLIGGLRKRLLIAVGL